LLAALVGCGSPSSKPTPAPGSSFDVVAHLALDGGAPMGATVPDSVGFSVTLDRAHAAMLVGGGGITQVVPMISGGWTFRAGTSVDVSIPNAGPCEAPSGIHFETLELTLGSSLTGTAKGTATVFTGDLGMTFQFTATLTGGPDVTAPFLMSSQLVDNPFDSFEVLVSEPLPQTATADLVASDGSRIALEPVLSDGDVKVITAFKKPDVVLPLTGGFSISVDGLVDFAGNQGASGAPLRLVAFDVPPLVPADGFESAMGTVGGATIVGGGPIPAIDGMQSAYIGATAPSPTGVTPGRGLFVRIPRAATDTSVRFSYRILAGPFPAFFDGRVFAGSAGGPVAMALPFATALGGTPLDATATPIINASGVMAMAVPLADRIDGEVAVMIEEPQAGCVSAPRGVGLLVDDLRAE
jgi:hypothetical protein